MAKKDARVACGAALSVTFALGWMLVTAFAHSALFAGRVGADLGASPALVGLLVGAVWGWLVCYQLAPRLAGRCSHWGFAMGLAAGFPAAAFLLLVTTPGGAVDGLFHLVFLLLTLGLIPESVPGSGAALAVMASSIGLFSFLGFLFTEAPVRD